MKLSSVLFANVAVGLSLASYAHADIVIQPSAESNSKEAKLYSHLPTLSLQSDLSVTSPDIGAHFASLLQFDLAALGSLAAQDITSAYLRLYSPGLGFSGGPAAGGDVTLKLLLSPWRETAADSQPAGAPVVSYGALYDPAPTIGIGSVVATQTVTGEGFWQWDLTNTVKGWLDGSITNYGLLIELSSPGGDIGFADVDSSGAGKGPSLTVVPEPASGLLAFSVGAVLLARRRRAS